MSKKTNNRPPAPLTLHAQIEGVNLQQARKLTDGIIKLKDRVAPSARGTIVRRATNYLGSSSAHPLLPQSSKPPKKR
jgi:hypothetical protein